MHPYPLAAAGTTTTAMPLLQLSRVCVNVFLHPDVVEVLTGIVDPHRVDSVVERVSALQPRHMACVQIVGKPCAVALVSVSWSECCNAFVSMLLF